MLYIIIVILSGHSYSIPTIILWHFEIIYHANYDEILIFLIEI